MLQTVYLILKFVSCPIVLQKYTHIQVNSIQYKQMVNVTSHKFLNLFTALPFYPLVSYVTFINVLCTTCM